jgi:hypothetical protein
VINHGCHLKIHICLNSEPEDDFYLLSLIVIRSLFVSLTTSPATLEHLQFIVEFSGLVIDCDLFYDNLRDADLWRHLDSIIASHPTDSKLQRVDINIKYAAYDVVEHDVDTVKKAVFDCLPLLRMKGILFVSAVGRRVAENILAW